MPVSAGHHVTELAAHRSHPELKGCEQRLGARPSELRRWEQPFGSKNSVVKDQCETSSRGLPGRKCG